MSTICAVMPPHRGEVFVRSMLLVPFEIYEHVQEEAGDASTQPPIQDGTCTLGGMLAGACVLPPATMQSYELFSRKVVNLQI